MPDSFQRSSSRPRSLLSSIYTLLLLGGLVTVLAVLAYDFLPERRLELDSQAFIYADNTNSVEFIDYEARRWRCMVHQSQDGSFCGMNLHLGSDAYECVDLTQFHSIRLRLEYQGASPWLRYYFRNREPGFSTQADMQTHKFLQTHISTEFLNQELVIGLDEFYVAEWWLAAYQVPRELSRPDFSHVTAFGIDLSYPLVEGEHIGQLHSVELLGDWISKEQWYGGIIAIWLVAWVVVGVGGLLVLRRDILRERKRSQRYRELSHHDQLTGLLNRHGITRAIEALFTRPDTALTLLMLDIDHFKSLNDLHGHHVGDQVLTQLGQLLPGRVRSSDSVGRWGGEEFIVLLPGTGQQAAVELADKLRSHIAQQAFAGLKPQAVTVSIGIAERAPHESYHELFKRADTALYRAKAQGRNQCVAADAIA